MGRARAAPSLNPTAGFKEAPFQHVQLLAHFLGQNEEGLRADWPENGLRRLVGPAVSRGQFLEGGDGVEGGQGRRYQTLVDVRDSPWLRRHARRRPYHRT